MSNWIAFFTDMPVKINLAMDLRDSVGCFGVVVDVKPESIEFYTGLGFSTLEVVRGTLGERPEPVPMFLPITVISSAASKKL